jgi:hypothetical protein
MTLTHTILSLWISADQKDFFNCELLPLIKSTTLAKRFSNKDICHARYNDYEYFACCPRDIPEHGVLVLEATIV